MAKKLVNMIFVILLFVIASILFIQVIGAADYNSQQTFSGVSYSGSYSNPATYQTSYGTYYSQGDINTYWPILNDEKSCEARQDLILQIAPAGCQPSVVRSDLLAEQNVPVFCQVDALKLNPILDINSIESISFRQTYPKEIAGIGFHPANAALKTRDKLLGSPVINNIGYVVVILKRTENESSLPGTVTAKLTGNIRYDAGNALGIGKAEFILKPQSNSEFASARDSNSQTFWNGRYSVRLEQAEPEFADISIYKGDIKVSTIRAEKGKTSSSLYLPGFYCQAKLQAVYDGYVAAEKKATLGIDGDVIDVYKGSRILNDKCYVENIEIQNRTSFGNVTINCGSYSNKVILQRQPLQDSMQTVSFAMGDEVIYRGNKAKIDRINSNGTYNILVYDSLLESYNQPYSDIEKNELIKNVSLVDKNYSLEADKSFDDAIAAYKEVALQYPAEKVRDVVNYSTYGEDALAAAINLAEKQLKVQTEANLINIYLKLYPTSPLVDVYNRKLQELYRIDLRNVGGTVYIDNKYRSVRLMNLENPIRKANAEFSVGNNPNKYLIELKGSAIELPPLVSSSKNVSKNSAGLVSLTSLTPEEARISARCYKLGANGQNTTESEVTYTFRLGQTGQNICGQSISLEKIDMESAAKIRLIPSANNVNSEANLTVKIGIEKRAIKLSPDKTKEVISNLNESIKKWESINNNLGKVVTGLKGACFATSAILTAKTFLTGLSGEGIARQKVMSTKWNAECQKLIASGKYKTPDTCYAGEAASINQDVTAYANSIKTINENIKRIEQPYTDSSGAYSVFGLDKSVDRSKSAEAYAQYLRDTYPDEPITKPDGTTVTVSKLLEKSPGEGYDNGTYTYDELKNIELNVLNRKSSSLKDYSEKQLTDVYTQIQDNKAIYSQVKDANALEKQGLGGTIFVETKNQKNYYGNVVPISDSAKSNAFDSSKGITHTVIVSAPRDVSVNGKNIPHGNYLAGLKSTGNGQYTIEEMVGINQEGGQTVYSSIKDSPKFAESFKSAYNIGTISPTDQISYNNYYKNPEIRYYETEPYKGMPAIVPIDLQKGWYAATKPNLPVFGGQGAFDASGRVSSFSLCNVGKNGIEQFQEGLGDDICQLINLNTGQPLNKFAGLDDRQAEILTGRAITAMRDAASQYGNGRSDVTINGNRLHRGKPATNIPATQCQDFMDPKDCTLLFNLCDPVICPSSRCDFGGKYPVANVVDTGIIGSIALCLPNFGSPAKGGVAIPVCLTGIHAGIEGYVSVLKAHRDCLQENLNTGRMIGICDQIYSIYACEFFWRQVAPFANILIPKIVELAYGGGQGARGGGEYLTVMGAWQNTKNSVDYFTNVYAVNSLKAFNLRNVEEAGSTFCKAFISAKSPTNLKSLIEPDSPPQFSAWFSSTPYTSVTVPATSQYKVFYHIYGGKDSGVYYRVYLKGSTNTGYYYTNPVLFVSSGFIAKGEYADQTKDFTAPVGYEELCVDINGDEKCGFKQVSTSFAINQLRDSYASDQINQTGIKSEKECISGTPSLGALLANTNPQAAAEEAALPQNYNRGIVRICATQNPGSSTEPLRFVDVGNCGDDKMKCWLDKKSVNNAISQENVYMKNLTLSDIETIQKQTLQTQGVILNDDQINVALADVRAKVTDVKTKYSNSDSGMVRQVVEGNLTYIDALFGRNLEKLFLNYNKAEVLFLKAELRGVLAYAYGKNAPSQITVVVAGNSNNAAAAPIPISNNGIRINASTYDFRKKTEIILDGKSTNLYLLSNKVFIVIDFVDPDSQVGAVNNRFITLLPNNQQLLSKDNLFNLVNNSRIENDRTDNQKLMLLEP